MRSGWTAARRRRRAPPTRSSRSRRWLWPAPRPASPSVLSGLGLGRIGGVGPEDDARAPAEPDRGSVLQRARRDDTLAVEERPVLAREVLEHGAAAVDQQLARGGATRRARRPAWARCSSRPSTFSPSPSSMLEAFAVEPKALARRRGRGVRIGPRPGRSSRSPAPSARSAARARRRPGSPAAERPARAGWSRPRARRARSPRAAACARRPAAARGAATRAGPAPWGSSCSSLASAQQLARPAVEHEIVERKPHGAALAFRTLFRRP